MFHWCCLEYLDCYFLLFSLTTTVPSWSWSCGSWIYKYLCNQCLSPLKVVSSKILTKLGTYLVLKRIWNPIDFQGHMSKVKVTMSNFLPRTILVNTLESTFFNGFWPNLVHTQSLGESGTLLMVKVTGSNFYPVTSLCTLESTSFNGFWPNLVHT